MTAIDLIGYMQFCHHGMKEILRLKVKYQIKILIEKIDKLI